MSETKKGNPEGVVQAFISNRSFLAAWVNRFVSRPEDVEDIVQETFLRSYRALMSREIDNPKAYLFSAAKNLAIKHNELSANKFACQIDDMGLSEVISIDDPVLQSAEAREEMSCLSEAIRELPVQCRRVFVLKRVYGLSHREIADRLGISPNTVHQHLSKGVARCTFYMRDKGYARDSKEGYARNGKEGYTRNDKQSYTANSGSDNLAVNRPAKAKAE